MIQDPELVRFGVGLAAGAVVGTAALNARHFATAVLVAAAAAVLFVLLDQGPDGLIRVARALAAHVQDDVLFYRGVVVGKFVAGLGKWVFPRRRLKS